MMISAVQFYDKTCRICGITNGINANLLERKNEQYLDQIHKLLPIEIKSTDNLPKNICHSCIATLNDFKYLLNKCVTVQKGLIITAEQLRSEKERPEKYSSDKETISLTHADTSSKERNNDNVTESKEFMKTKNPRVKSKKLTSSRELIRKQRNNNNDNGTEFMNINSGKKSSNEIDNRIDVASKDETDFAELSQKLVEKEKMDATSTFKYNPDDWIIQKIPGNNDTTLYICVKCNSILVCESAIGTHACSPDIEEELSHNARNKIKRPHSTETNKNMKFASLHLKRKQNGKSKRIFVECEAD